MAEEGSSYDQPQDHLLDTTPQIPSEILEKLPESDRQRVLEFFAASMWSGPNPNPVWSRMTSQHITDLISLAAKTADITLDDRKHTRRFSFAAFLALLVASLTLLLVLAIRGQDNLILEIIKLAAVGLGGSGLGYGFARWRSDE